MSNEAIESIKRRIADYRKESKWEEVGFVTEAADGIIKISGLSHCQSQELLEVETEAGERIPALALNLEEDSVGALLLAEPALAKSGQTVKRTNRILSLPVGKNMLGRVVDCLGNPLDGLGPMFSQKEQPTHMPLESSAPNVLDREPVNAPMHTGIKVIDAIIPIGRGQRELIIGDRQTGKTALALDMIINQGRESKAPAVCIYVAIGQKEAKIASLAEILKREGAMDYTIIVAAPASSPASFWYLAPFAGCAIGEYFRDRGQDALVIYDDLSKHAWAWRQISLLLRRPPGREAYPGDIFYLHSRLLERAAKLSQERGGGSLTAIPIIETQLNDVTGYIPTNVISITDGQIYLESDLFYQGTRPAVSAGLSVSRVGSAAQTKAMKKVAGKLRLELAQFRELQAFSQFAADVDEATRQKIDRGRIVTEVLKQPDLHPMLFEHQVLVLYAAVNGYFDRVSLGNMSEAQAKLIEYTNDFYHHVLEDIRQKRDLAPETETHMKTAIEVFIKEYNAVT